MTHREESTQFSLTELLKLEDDRVAEVRRTAETREKAAAQARRDAATRAAEEEALRAATAAKTALDEMARREAMQKAIVEQARLDVEARARTEERELERTHELALATLRTEGKRGDVGTLLGGALLGAVAILASALAIHFAFVRPANERRVQQLTSAVESAEARATDLEQRREGDRKLIAALRARPAEEAAGATGAPATGAPGRAPAGRVWPPRGAPARAVTGAPSADPCAGSKDPICGLQR